MARGSESPIAVAVACAAGVYLFSVVAVSGLRVQDTSRNRSIWAGAFTTAQADRGLLAYERSCTKCHQSDLQGSQDTEAPALVGDTFMSQWGGQSIGDLLDKISTKMPADKPASLERNAYVDIVAYLLHANKFPAGSNELDLKPESLAQTISERAPAGTKD